MRPTESIDTAAKALLSSVLMLDEPAVGEEHIEEKGEGCQQQGGEQDGQGMKTEKEIGAAYSKGDTALP